MVEKGPCEECNRWRPLAGGLCFECEVEQFGPPQRVS